MKYFDTDAAAYASIMQMAAADANLMVHTVRSLDAQEADLAAAPSISNSFLHTRKGNGRSDGHGRHGGRGRKRKCETISLCSLDPDPDPFGS